KELSEQATVAKSSVGIDVGKSWLDIHVLPSAETLRVANTREGVRKLKRWLAGFHVALIVVEATGKWHRQVRRSLHTEGFAVAVASFLKRQLERRLARIAKDITALEHEIDKRIAADEALARRYVILTSIPGFGAIVAATLVACLTELGTCSRKQIGLLAGVA